jgi:hypothetical protein
MSCKTAASLAAKHHSKNRGYLVNHEGRVVELASRSNGCIASHEAGFGYA